MKQLEGVDVIKCIGCRMGIEPLIPESKTKPKDFLHLDLFATPEAGKAYVCGNSATISKYLTMTDRGVCLSSKELHEILEWQNNWWEDVTDLMAIIFQDKEEEAGRFFTLHDLGNKSNEDFEKIVVKEAEDRGFPINELRYPFLILWEKEVKDEQG